MSSVTSLASRLINEAMAFCKVDNSAYLRAVERCPEVVATESPPERFLSFCLNNARDAADRLSMYWSLRLEVFGEGRAFLPLTEALNEEDRAYMMHGLWAILPADKQGRPVVVVDRTRIAEDPDLDFRKRSTWFYLHMVTNMSNTKSDGDFVIILAFNPKAKGAYNNEMLSFLRRCFDEAFCGKAGEVHFAAALPHSAKRTLQKEMVPMLTKRSPWMEGCPLSVHTGSPEEILSTMAPTGLSAKVLPPFCGGSWSYERDWKAWLQRNLAASPPRPSQGDRHDAASALNLLGLVADQQSSFEANDVLMKRSGAARIVEDAKPAALKYPPQPPPAVQNLQFFADGMLKPPPPSVHGFPQRGGKSPVSKRLKAIAAGTEPGAAATIVATPVATGTDTVASASPGGGSRLEELLMRERRRQNVVYSRRKRAKQKAVEQSLEQQVHYLKKQNARLKQDEQRLARLLKQAKTTVSQQMATQQQQQRPNQQQQHLNMLLQWQRRAQMPPHMAAAGFAPTIAGMGGFMGPLPLTGPMTAIAAAHGQIPMRGLLMNQMNAGRPIAPVMTTQASQAAASLASVGGQTKTPQAQTRPSCGSTGVQATDLQASPEPLAATTAAAALGKVDTVAKKISPTGRPSKPAEAAVTVTRAAELRASGCVPMSNAKPVPPVATKKAVVGTPGNVSLLPGECPYRKALEVCPDVVKAESPPERFISWCNFDAWAAAERLSGYWRLRVEVFGPTRAFWPIKDALLPKDVAYMSKGIWAVLPEDSQGRPVAVCDRSRVTEIAPFEVRQRTTMFYLNTLCNVKAKEKGDFLLILVFHAKSKGGYDGDNLLFLRRCFEEAFCGRLAQLHLVADLPHTAKRTLLQTMLPMLSKRAGAWLDKAPTTAHTGSPEELLSSLVRHGLSAPGLPRSCGGSWSYESDWIRWLRAHWPSIQAEPKLAQCVVKNAVPASLAGHLLAAKVPESSTVVDDSVLKRAVLPNSTVPPPNSTKATLQKEALPQTKAKAQLVVDQPSVAPGSSRLEELLLKSRRRQNVVYSRRKRAKQKAVEHTLKQQEQNLLKHKERLKQEESRLKSLLSQAQNAVARQESAISLARGQPALPVVTREAMLRRSAAGNAGSVVQHTPQMASQLMPHLGAPSTLRPPQPAPVTGLLPGSGSALAHGAGLQALQQYQNPMNMNFASSLSGAVARYPFGLVQPTPAPFGPPALNRDQSRLLEYLQHMRSVGR